jgi:nondiscriminating glutamyl-tRNA synthetase
LNWINGFYIRNMALPDLLERAKPFMAEYDLSQYSEDKLCLMLGAVREPVTVLSELKESVSYFFGEAVQYDEESQEVLKSEETTQVLRQFYESVLPNMAFDAPETIGAEIKAFANDLKPLKMKTIMWALRAAITGRVHGADLSKVLYILGKPLVTKRVEAALQTITC